MEPEHLSNKSNAPRKVRFAPKAPPRRLPKPEVKTEVVQDADAQAKELLRRINENAKKAKPKAERKVAPSQIAFGSGGASTSIKSYGHPKGSSISQYFSGGASASGLRQEKEYKEPWDYYSNYPITLPLRTPYSGNPDILDEEEFGEGLERTTYDENSLKSAVELGLMDENPEPTLFFLQLPPTLPMIKRAATAGSSEASSSSRPSAKGKSCSLNELPAGFMGKMLVYRSGAVKLKLGDILYDVNPGMDCVFAQDVVAINTAQKQCCVIGELKKHVTVTPDVDSILPSMADLR